jgi:hypothetical protein
MIGTTQLINTKLSPAAGTADSPFTTYADVASSGLSNGLYYFNDGTRTRQMYFDIDGTENGTSTAGWARWDTNIDSNYYNGSECVLADSGIASNGTISIRSSNYPTGIYSSQGNTSTNHGACGIGTEDQYVKASKIAFSDPVFTNAASYYKNSRFYIYKSPETFRSDWKGNQAGNCGSYYPGTCVFPTSGHGDTTYMLLYMALNVNSPGASNAPPSTRTSSNEASFLDGTYKIVEGYEYQLGETADILFHFGQINYSGNGYKHSFKMWFKY